MKQAIIFFFLLFAFPVFAHVIKIDNGFEGMMHILPDDNPVAGTTTDFYFMFENNAKAVTSCDCTVTVLKNEKVLFSQNIRNKFSFYFPKIGVYTVNLSSKNFNLNWDVRIDKDIRDYSKYYIIAFGVIALLLGLIVLKRRHRD